MQLQELLVISESVMLHSDEPGGDCSVALQRLADKSTEAETRLCAVTTDNVTVQFFFVMVPVPV